MAAAANAQAATFNCTGSGSLPNTCHAVSDAYPTTGIQPVSCKLFRCVGACTPVAPALTSSPVLIVSGAASCNTVMPPASFPNGTYTLSATAVAADGSESAMSAPFSFTSSAGPPAVPVNSRVVQP